MPTEVKDKQLLGKKCPMCKTMNYVEVNTEDVAIWEEGSRDIQDTFPYLSADDREILVTGICTKCWDKCFPN